MLINEVAEGLNCHNFRKQRDYRNGYRRWKWLVWFGFFV